MSGDPLDRARAAKALVRELLGTDPRVVGVGIARGLDATPSIRVQVVDAACVDQLGLPPEVDGVAVDVRVVGEVEAQG